MLHLNKIFLLLQLPIVLFGNPLIEDDGRYHPEIYGQSEGKYRPSDEGRYIPGDEGRYTYIYRQTPDYIPKYIHIVGPDGPGDAKYFDNLENYLNSDGSSLIRNISPYCDCYKGDNFTYTQVNDPSFYKGKYNYSDSNSYKDDPKGYYDKNEYKDKFPYSDKHSYNDNNGYNGKNDYSDKHNYNDDNKYNPYSDKYPYNDKGSYSGNYPYKETNSYKGDYPYKERNSYSGNYPYKEKNSYDGKYPYSEKNSYAGENKYSDKDGHDDDDVPHSHEPSSVQNKNEPFGNPPTYNSGKNRNAPLIPNKGPFNGVGYLPPGQKPGGGSHTNNPNKGPFKGIPYLPPGFDKNGVPNVDENGNPIIPNVDENGNPIAHNVDENGYPIGPNADVNGYPIVPNVDENGNPIVPNVDENGYPIVPNVDEHGNPITPNIDEYGNPIQPNNDRTNSNSPKVDEFGIPIRTNINERRTPEYEKDSHTPNANSPKVNIGPNRNRQPFAGPQYLPPADTNYNNFKIKKDGVNSKDDLLLVYKGNDRNGDDIEDKVKSYTDNLRTIEVVDGSELSPEGSASSVSSKVQPGSPSTRAGAGRSYKVKVETSETRSSSRPTKIGDAKVRVSSSPYHANLDQNHDLLVNEASEEGSVVSEGKGKKRLKVLKVLIFVEEYDVN